MDGRRWRRDDDDDDDVVAPPRAIGVGLCRPIVRELRCAVVVGGLAELLLVQGVQVDGGQDGVRVIPVPVLVLAVHHGRQVGGVGEGL